MPHPVAAVGNASATAPLVPITINRREPTDIDVEIDILFCGICHSDIHQARAEWAGTVFPCVPGHEIVGRVHSLGKSVEKFKVGDIVAVGCQVDADHDCIACKAHCEAYCPNITWTYQSHDKHLGGVTHGGYSKSVVVDQDFVFSVPQSLHQKLAAVAPLVCAGITTYSPLRHWNVSKGHKVGVVGLGGLGHMAVKFAAAMGAHVVVFTHSPNKADEAKRLGANEIIVSSDRSAMRMSAGTFDFILDTVSAEHDLNMYIRQLKFNGNIVIVGLGTTPLSISAQELIGARRHLSGSLIGSPDEIQEMLNFCGEHDITADVEVISADKVNEAYERVLKSDVKYRFSIDLSTL